MGDVCLYERQTKNPVGVRDPRGKMAFTIMTYGAELGI